MGAAVTRHLAATMSAAVLAAIPSTALAGPAREAALAHQLRVERTQHAHQVRELRMQARGLRRTLAHHPSVREALTIASVAYGVSRHQLSAVAWCESTHQPSARNGQYRGLFQTGPMFEASPYGRAGLSVWSPYASAMTAAYTVRREGWRQWECRKVIR